jgi:hypothetical protein
VMAPPLRVTVGQSSANNVTSSAAQLPVGAAFIELASHRSGLPEPLLRVLPSQITAEWAVSSSPATRSLLAPLLPPEKVQPLLSTASINVPRAS